MLKDNYLWIIWSMFLGIGLILIPVIIPKEYQNTSHMWLLIISFLLIIIKLVLSTLRNTNKTKQKKEKLVLTKELQEEITKAVKDTEKEYISIKSDISNEPLPNISSKFGGKPYFTSDIEKDLKSFFKGQDYYMLAQINLFEIPKIKLLPEKGLLQFYIAGNQVYMKDPENGFGKTNQAFVKYIPFIEETKQIEYPEKKFEESPLIGEFALSFNKEKSYISMMDYNFDELVNNNEKLKAIDDIFELIEEQYNKVNPIPIGNNKEVKHQILGYPLFVQYDVRSKIEYSDYILLFQIDSQYKNKTWEILWGDVGIANFFIREKDLLNKDFSNILFNWDCA